MSTATYILGYALAGGLWAWWLEYFTTNNLEGELGRKWSIFEKIFHSVLWVLSLGVFLLGFIREINKRR